MTWTPILHSSASASSSSSSAHTPVSSAYSSSSTSSSSGWVVSWPNKFSHCVDVRMHVRDVLVSVHMPWEDRWEGFSEFLEVCFSFLRLEVEVSGEGGGGAGDQQGAILPSVRRYTLWANAEETTRQMRERGFLEGEPYFLAALRQMLPCSLLPCEERHAHVYKIGRNVASSATAATSFSSSASQQQHSSSSSSCSHQQLLPLYSHQRKSLSWMMGIESAIVSGRNVLTYEACVPVAGNICYDPHLETLRTDKGATLKARYKGGLLTDGVGTGKTAVAIRLVAASKLAFRAPAGMLTAKGTIILVPMNILLQWTSEVAKFGPGLKTVVLSCAKEMKQTSLQDLLDADLVLTTTNYFKNPTVREGTEDFVRTRLGLRPDIDRKECRSARSMKAASRSIGTESAVSGRPDVADTLPPIVELVYWQRIVVDEVREVVAPGAKERLKVVRSLQGRVFWGMTATPDASTNDALQTLHPFLLEPKMAEDTASAMTYHPCLQKGVEKGLMVKFASSKPSVDHRKVVVHPSPSETIMLDSYVMLPPPSEGLLHEDQQQATPANLAEANSNLAATQLLPPPFSLPPPSARLSSSSSSPSLMSTDKVTELLMCTEEADATELIRSDALERVSKMKQRVAKLETNVVRLSFASPRGGSPQALSVAVRTLSEAEASMTSCERGYAFLEQRLRGCGLGGEGGEGGEGGDNGDSDASCGVCFDARPNMILSCGHSFCSSCVKRFASICPFCKATFTRVASNAPSSAPSFSSSKLDETLRLAKEIVDREEQTLVFSQFGGFLAKVCSLLVLRGVRASLLSGPTSRRGILLKKFQEGEIDVLALQLEKSSAGCHLSSADNVIFAHPVLADSPHERRALEEQAIGRAARGGNHVTVHHLVSSREEERTWEEQRKHLV